MDCALYHSKLWNFGRKRLFIESEYMIVVVFK